MTLIIQNFALPRISFVGLRHAQVRYVINTDATHCLSCVGSGHILLVESYKVAIFTENITLFKKIAWEETILWGGITVFSP